MRKPGSWLELSEGALRDNLQFLKRHIGRKVEFCSVIKANAYGPGMAEFVPLAERCGVRRFGVFSAEEAAHFLQYRTADSALMIMGHLDNADIDWAVANDLEFWVFDLSRLEAAERAAARAGRPARIHLEVETGMYRLGLSARALNAAARRIKRQPDRLQLEGLCTHFAGAESSANAHRIGSQQKVYAERLDSLNKAGISNFKRHLCCSAAAFGYPESLGDMARVGIAQYGFWPSLETRMLYKASVNGRRVKGRLRRVLAWRSRLFNVKSVPAGRFVGYGNSYLTAKKMRIGAIPVGYHHGIERSQSNLGHVLVHGSRCPIVGIINMNMMSVDVTDLPAAKDGDEVTIIGRQGDDEITVGAFGNRINDLNYETLARLHTRLDRVVVD
jgi:alanine racemase